MGRRADEQLLESINHRLTLLEQMSHRMATLDEFNDRLTKVLERLEFAEVDRSAVAGIAANLNEIAEAIAGRFERAEERLETTEARLLALLRGVEQTSTGTGELL